MQYDIGISTASFKASRENCLCVCICGIHQSYTSFCYFCIHQTQLLHMQSMN